MTLSGRNIHRWKIAILAIIFGILFIFLCVSFDYFYNLSLDQLRINQLNLRVFSKKLEKSNQVSGLQNRTHLWSLRLADNEFFRLARLLPCRTVEYTGGPRKYQVNSCVNSSTNEFSVENTLQAQKWLFNHQHPINCTGKQFAIIRHFAWSGFGSTVHQIAWALGMALADNRIAVYETKGNWLYGNCNSTNPDCIFLPITNCSVPRVVNGKQTIYINANFGFWSKPIHPFVFQNRTFNWYRAQLIFYIMRYKPETLDHVQKTITKYLKRSSIDLYRPFIAVYVRRSDKISGKEMARAYSLKEYFDLFDADARRANITNIYLNSEDDKVFNEFTQINQEKQGYYKLLTIKTTKKIVFASLTRMSKQKRGDIVLEFLTDLFIEAHADLHAGTLSSNWCRLVDELRLALGKTLTYYTPENKYRL